MATYRSISTFMNPARRPARFLLVEPNPYHGELLPGFVRHFQALGHTVDVLVRHEVAAEDPFARYPIEDTPTLYQYDLEQLVGILASSKTRQYERIFCSTNVLWQRDIPQSDLVTFLGFEPTAQRDTLFVEHNLTYVEIDKSTDFLKAGRLFTLLPYEYEGQPTKMINPHYFGTVATEKTAQAVINVCVVGSSSFTPKHTAMLFETARRLKQATWKGHITCVTPELAVPTDLTEIITVTGRMNFTDYYDVVERSHYLTTFIDLESDDIIHSKYRTGTTSGTVQVALGFNTPVIIDEVHARAYGFSEANSIVYKPGSLYEALLSASDSSNTDYELLRADLAALASRYDESSRMNLAEALDVAPPTSERTTWLSRVGQRLRG